MSCVNPVTVATACALPSSSVSSCLTPVNLASLEPCQWLAAEAYQLHSSFKLARSTVDGVGGGWARVYSNLNSQPIPLDRRRHRACVRYVQYCIAADSYRVLGLTTAATTQLSEAGYIALATPYLAAAPSLQGIKTFALEFFGTKLAYGSAGSREFVGSTDYYQVYHKTAL